MHTHVLQAAAATGAILAAEIPYDASDWVQMVERLGLAVALVVFFVVTGWKREQRMAKRLDWLEKENDKLATKTATLAEQVNVSLLQASNATIEMLKVLDGRMCWACNSRDEFVALQQRLATERESKK